MKTRTMDFERTVDGAPDEVFYAFSTAQGWRDWMCDSARFEARPKGTYQLSWNQGWYASGSVHSVVSPDHLQMSWRGADDPGETEVEIHLSAAGEQTRVTIHHSGFGDEPVWERVRDSVKRGWDTGFENLESIFHKGVDLRISRRPMLGIFVNDYNETIAREIGVPIFKGVRIDKAVKGMGAEAAGIQSDDVVVEMNGNPITGFTDLAGALSGQHAGDQIPVVFYRGPERMTVDMTLSGRQLADVPLDPRAIADTLRPIYTTIMEDLRKVFDGVSEVEADRPPGPEEWSAKGIVAHLIDSEGYTQAQIAEFLYDGEREYPDQAGNVDEVVEAIVEVTPTIPALLDRLERCKHQTLALLSRATKLKSRKGPLWRLGQALLQVPDSHERNHMEQIQRAIEAAREAGV